MKNEMQEAVQSPAFFCDLWIYSCMMGILFWYAVENGIGSSKLSNFDGKCQIVKDGMAVEKPVESVHNFLYILYDVLISRKYDSQIA